MTPKEKLRELVLARVAKGHSVTLRKAVPKNKSPTGKAVPAEKIQVPGCSSKLLFSKSIRQATKLSNVEIEAVLGAMRKEGVIHCTNELWWKR